VLAQSVQLGMHCPSDKLVVFVKFNKAALQIVLLITATWPLVLAVLVLLDIHQMQLALVYPHRAAQIIAPNVMAALAYVQAVH